MGTMHHNAIIATISGEQERDAVLRYVASLPEADQRYFAVSDIFTNRYFTVVLFPDGSKEGWETSDQGDARRAAFKDWLVGRIWWHVVEVGYGELGLSVRETDTEDEGDGG